MEYDVNDDFIGFLVEKTLGKVESDVPSTKKDAFSQYQEHVGKSKPIAKGFLRSMKIFCNEHGIKYAEGFYRKDVKCFHLNVLDNELDIPGSWAKFPADFKSRSRGALFSMDYEDPSLFPKILSKILTLKIKRLHCFNENNKCIFVFLNEFHLRRFKKYFERISITENYESEEIKKAG